MRLRFIPQEARFYEEFTAMASRVQDGARLLREMLAGEMADHPGGGDPRRRELRLTQHHPAANKTFVTDGPKSIHALAGRLDDVMDAIDAATLFPLTDIGNVRKGRRRARDRASATVSPSNPRAKTGGVEIHTLEHDADLLHAGSVRQLFKDRRDHRDHQWRRSSTCWSGHRRWRRSRRSSSSTLALPPCAASSG